MSKRQIEKTTVIYEPFEQWAERAGKDIVNLYVNNNKFLEDILIVAYSRIMSGINSAIKLKYGHIGISKFHENDIKKQAIDITIAFYRMMGWELPKAKRVVEKHISELRRGDKIFDFSGRKYNCPNCPTMEFVDVYRGDMIVWDIEKQGFSIFVPKDGGVYKVLEED